MRTCQHQKVWVNDEAILSPLPLSPLLYTNWIDAYLAWIVHNEFIVPHRAIITCRLPYRDPDALITAHTERRHSQKVVGEKKSASQRILCILIECGFRMSDSAALTPRVMEPLESRHQRQIP